MEDYEGSFSTAQQKIQLADYLITMTYPGLKDPKVLLLALENIFLAMMGAMEGVLQFELLYKRIEPYQPTFEGRIHAFAHLTQTYHTDPAIIITARDIKEIITKHQQSPMEFTRKDKYIICSPEYDMTALTLITLKKHLATAKAFVQDMATQVTTHEGISRRSIS